MARSEDLAAFAPNMDVVNVDGGHRIRQERPDETYRATLAWLE